MYLETETVENVAYSPDSVADYTLMAARNPWLPQLILREVLTDGGVLRETFIGRFGGGLGGVLGGVLKQAQAEGALRRDLAVEHLAMSLISLCVFPFIATPLVAQLKEMEPGIKAGDASAAGGVVFHAGGTAVRQINQTTVVAQAASALVPN